VLLRNKQGKKISVHFFNIDNELVYWNFFLDFGPLNLGQLYRFCTKLNHKLYKDNSSDSVKESTPSTTTTDATDTDTSTDSCICFYSAQTQAQRANAIFLICAWQVLHLNRTPAQAFRGFSFASSSSSKNNDSHDHDKERLRPSSTSNSSSSSSSSSIPPTVPLTSIGKATVGPLLPFHDASPCACTYQLHLMHCLQGLQKAKRFNFFNWDTFDIDEYEHFEQVEVRRLLLFVVVVVVPSVMVVV
jgi:cell division cycle 14